MPREFSSLAAFAAFLEERAALIHEGEHAGVEAAGKHLVEAARGLIGTEDSAWSALADSTITEKERLGFTGQVSATDPLLRRGDLRDSFGFNPTTAGLLFGSTAMTAPFFEYGTSKMPPRPVVSTVMFQHGGEAVMEWAAKVWGEVIGREVSPGHWLPHMG